MAPSKRIVELDCIRGITAFIVVFFHFSSGTTLFPYFRLFAGGTDLFFIISGFVGYNLLRSNPNVGEYSLKRFIRLIPMFWICASLTFGCMFLYNLKHGVPVEALVLQYFSNLSFLNYFQEIPFLDGVYWTLLIEVLFYAVLALILWCKGERYVEWGGALILGYLLITSMFPLGSFTLTHEATVNGFPLLIVWPSFYAGIIFNKIKYDQPSAWRWILIGLCLLTSILSISNSHTIHGVVNYLSPAENVGMTVLYFLVFYLAINSYVPFFINKASLFLAQISYCLYLVHNEIGRLFVQPKLKLLPVFWQILLMTGCVLVVAYVLSYFIEKPLLKKLHIKLFVANRESTEKSQVHQRNPELTL
ncbi:acyltransferase family protein [Rufibacter hautae]|uniref:Acyltransferase n=1 Tax=Rufibacter hautae TaxID=2595005 RepID=A0A5B6TCD7_9BACT|nr:acyltransferase [Rufibacter hautae]KAA3436684.1 acyltransferase [Rufibacter hautae]